MFRNVYLCFLIKHQAFQILSDFLVTSFDLVFPVFPVIVSSIALTSTSKAPPPLTYLHSLRIRNLNAVAYLPKKYYLCVEMAGEGLISRMSDECLMKGKSGSLYFGEYQAGMRKFTLAIETLAALRIGGAELLDTSRTAIGRLDLELRDNATHCDREVERSRTGD